MSEIEPALTAEEWETTDAFGRKVPQFRRQGAPPATLGGVALFVGSGRQCAEIDRRGNEALFHALAALCLHGQEFGFTWEDVDAIHEGDVALLEDLAERIAALLPPRTSSG